jgi:hypothetical protein
LTLFFSTGNAIQARTKKLINTGNGQGCRQLNFKDYAEPQAAQFVSVSVNIIFSIRTEQLNLRGERVNPCRPP